MRGARADRIDLAFLDRAQQLHLHVERQVANLVQEQRTSVRLDEFAAVFFRSARESTLLVAEQNALHEVFRDGAAVDRDERLGAAFARSLNGAGDKFLADACFALDENWNVAGGGLLAEPDDPVHGRTVGDHVLECQRAFGCPPHALDLALQRLDAQRVLDRYLQAFGRNRLDDEVERTRPHRGNDGVDAALGGLHDDRQINAALAHRFHDGQAAGSRHHQVENQKREVAAARTLQQGKRRIAAFRRGRIVTDPAHGGFKQPTLHWIVIDDKDMYAHSSRLLPVENIVLFGPIWHRRLNIPSNRTVNKALAVWLSAERLK